MSLSYTVQYFAVPCFDLDVHYCILITTVFIIVIVVVVITNLLFGFQGHLYLDRYYIYIYKIFVLLFVLFAKLLIWLHSNCSGNLELGSC